MGPNSPYYNKYESEEIRMTLDFLKRKLVFDLPKGILQNLEMYLVEDASFERWRSQATLHIESELLREKRIKTVLHTEKHHLNWFQMFKEKYLPRWYLKKYPVQYEVKTIEINIEQSFCFPDAYVKGSERFGEFFIWEDVIVKKEDV